MILIKTLAAEYPKHDVRVWDIFPDDVMGEHDPVLHYRLFHSFSSALQAPDHHDSSDGIVVASGPMPFRQWYRVDAKSRAMEITQQTTLRNMTVEMFQPGNTTGDGMSQMVVGFRRHAALSHMRTWKKIRKNTPFGGIGVVLAPAPSNSLTRDFKLSGYIYFEYEADAVNYVLKDLGRVEDED